MWCATGVVIGLALVMWERPGRWLISGEGRENSI